MRALIPWLVAERDLRRYLSRALRVCKSGRVIFFYHADKNRKVLLALSRYPDSRGALSSAFRMFAEGQVKKVRLEDLPKIRLAGKCTHRRLIT